MAPPERLSAILLALFTALAASQQQSLLVDGNSQLPACAQSCQLLIQASSACVNTPTQQDAWVCFCQSAYLTALRQSAATICPTGCASQTDLAQISTWYSSNCGSDNGASEHQGGAAPAPSSSGAGNAQATSANAVAGATSAPSTPMSGTAQDPPGDWWSGHYQWIIMLIVLAILLPAVGVLAHWLKRRHDRRRDQNRDGFNAGITSRAAPVGRPDHGASGAMGSADVGGDGRTSPARTRNAFMPYGYGYNRSESRMDSRQDRASPMPGDGAPDVEKNSVAVAAAAAGTPDIEPEQKKQKRVLVRERSGADSIEAEKGSRY